MNDSRTPLQYFFKDGPESRTDYLVVWLHGLGADGYDFAPVSETLKLPCDLGFRFVFPHAPERPVTCNGGEVMRSWYDFPDLGRPDRISLREVEESCRLVSDLIETQTKETGTPFEKVFVGGFSQGGVIAFHLGLNYPLKLAGILSLSSYLAFPDRLEAAHHANAATPIFMAHGTGDEIIPYAFARKAAEALEKIERPLKFERHDEGHNVPMGTLRAIGEWIAQNAKSD